MKKNIIHIQNATKQKGTVTSPLYDCGNFSPFFYHFLNKFLHILPHKTAKILQNTKKKTKKTATIKETCTYLCPREYKGTTVPESVTFCGLSLLPPNDAPSQYFKYALFQSYINGFCVSSADN